MKALIIVLLAVIAVSVVSFIFFVKWLFSFNPNEGGGNESNNNHKEMIYTSLPGKVAPYLFGQRFVEYAYDENTDITEYTVGYLYKGVRYIFREGSFIDCNYELPIAYDLNQKEDEDLPGDDVRFKIMEV